MDCKTVVKLTSMVFELILLSSKSYDYYYLKNITTSLMHKLKVVQQAMGELCWEFPYMIESEIKKFTQSIEPNSLI